MIYDSKKHMLPTCTEHQIHDEYQDFNANSIPISIFFTKPLWQQVPAVADPISPKADYYIYYTNNGKIFHKTLKNQPHSPWHDLWWSMGQGGPKPVRCPQKIPDRNLGTPYLFIDIAAKGSSLPLTLAVMNSGQFG